MTQVPLLGDTDAYADRYRFRSAWLGPTEHPALSDLLAGDSWLLRGRRGSGKSAATLAIADALGKTHRVFVLSLENFHAVIPPGSLADFTVLFQVLFSELFLCITFGPQELVKITKLQGPYTTASECIEWMHITIDLWKDGALTGRELRRRQSHASKLHDSTLDRPPSLLVVDDTDELFEDSSEGRAILIAVVDALRRLRTKLRTLNEKNTVIATLQEYSFPLLRQSRIGPFLAGSFGTLHWTRELVGEFLGRRIALTMGGPPDWKSACGRYFTGPVDQILGTILELMVAGPRDVLTLLGIARQHTPGRISVDTLQSVRHAYASEMMSNLEAEFKATYPGIRTFIESTLGTVPKLDEGRILTKQDLRGLVTGVVAQDPAEALFENQTWFRDSGWEGRIDILERVGTLRRVGQTFHLHPAYVPALGGGGGQ